MPTRNVTKSALLATAFSVYAMSQLTGVAFGAVPSAFERNTEHSQLRHVEAKFEQVGPEAEAVTYREGLVPLGASVRVVSAPSPVGTFTLLQVSGLESNREYGAHVHTYPCGPEPDDAGPHFQHVPDPAQPSIDPAYANPRNEIWLDFTTDARGGAISWSWVPWRIGDRPAGSVVIHDHHTRTGAGHAGDAGDRLACVDVPLGGDEQSG